MILSSFFKMKNLTKIIFLTFLMTIFTVLHITADLIEVEKQSCVSKIKNFFEECEGDKTIKDQVTFVFLNAVPIKMTSSQNEILREYTKHILKTAWLSGGYRKPHDFCKDFEDNPENCIEMLKQNAKEIFEPPEDLLESSHIMKTIYNNYSLSDEPGFYVKAYMNDVKRFIRINEIYLDDVDTVELFCALKECDYQLQFGLPNISTAWIHGYENFVFLNTDIERIPENHHHTMKYVHFVYGGIDEKKAIYNLITPDEFCKERYKSHKKICTETINSYFKNKITKKVNNNAENKKEYLKRMFFHLTPNNTNGVQIGNETINFIYQYMQSYSHALPFDYRKLFFFNRNHYCKNEVLNTLPN